MPRDRPDPPSDLPGSHTPAGWYAVDGHAHWYRCFPRERFLDSAADNLGRAAGSSVPGVLCVHATPRETTPLSADGPADGPTPGRWTIAATAEEGSWLASRDDGARLLLLGGRQTVTAEGLELLVLGADTVPPDGLPLSEALAAARGEGRLVTLPWGVGKWSLGRGRLIARLIDGEEPGTLFFGDNGGRPRHTPRPRLLRRAEARGFRVLSGSDPLPFAREVARVGAHGFRVRGEPDLRRPRAALVAALSDPRTEIRGFGPGRRLLPFLRDQLALRLRGRSER